MVGVAADAFLFASTVALDDFSVKARFGLHALGDLAVAREALEPGPA
jgi:hypothetical protein